MLREIDDNSLAKTPPNLNMVPDFLKESDDKTEFSEFMPPSCEKLDPLEKLQREEIEFSKSSENFNGEHFSKCLLAEDLSVLFPGRINNIEYEKLERVSKTLFYDYSDAETAFRPENLGLPRCVSVRQSCLSELPS